MAKRLLFLLCCITFFSARSQNLVANTGFEERNTCIEYGVKCAPEAWFFLPRYAKMSPMEGDSNHFEIIVMGNPKKPTSIGNFIYTKLLCPLVAGAKYRVKLRVNTNGVEFDYLDFWTGATEPWKGRYSYSAVRPSFTVTTDSVAPGNTKHWRTLTYTFKARGGERFFLLGNLSQQPLEHAKKKIRRKEIIEYGIDDISLYALDPSVAKCIEYEAIKDQVYRNDYRHPGRFIDDIEIDSSLFTGRKKETVVKKDPPPVVITKTTPKIDTLIIPDVLFKFDKSDLNPKFASRLDSFVTSIKNRVYDRLVIAGHTDDLGTGAYNLKLSEDRANTIRNYLLDKLGIRRELIAAVGYGETIPRASNATAEGRQQNRRVEIIIFH